MKRGKTPKLEGYATEPWYYKANYALMGLRVGNLIESWRASGHHIGEDTNDLRHQIMAQADRLSTELLQAAQVLGPRRWWQLRGSLAERNPELRSVAPAMATALEPVIVALEVLLKADGETTKRIEALQQRVSTGSALFCYNLACLLSLDAERRNQVEGETVETAVKGLVRAVGFEPFRESQIHTDSLLVHLAKTEAFRAAFGGGVEVKPPMSNAAQLDLVGNEFGRVLGENGIKSLQDLFLATAPMLQRRKLALALNVSEVLALRWAYLAELCRVDGLEVAAINLLRRAEVGSLEALATSEVKALAELLASLQRVARVEVEIETKDLIGWVDRAGQLLPTMVQAGP